MMRKDQKTAERSRHQGTTRGGRTRGQEKPTPRAISPQKHKNLYFLLSNKWPAMRAHPAWQRSMAATTKLQHTDYYRSGTRTRSPYLPSSTSSHGFPQQLLHNFFFFYKRHQELFIYRSWALINAVLVRMNTTIHRKFIIEICTQHWKKTRQSLLLIWILYPKLRPNHPLVKIQTTYLQKSKFVEDCDADDKIYQHKIKIKIKRFGEPILRTQASES